MSIWLPIAAVVVVLWVWSRLRPSPMALAGRAVSTGDLAPLLASLERVSAGAQPTEYNRVIRRLWNGYHREEAVHLAKALARQHRSAPVAQFWLRQFLQSEPEIAREHLDEGFLAAFYDPAIAAKCGSYG